MKWRLRLKKSFIALCIESEMALGCGSYHKKCLVDKSESRPIAYVAPSLRSLRSLKSLTSLTSLLSQNHQRISVTVPFFEKEKTLLLLKPFSLNEIV